jgi:hypothetical protein
MNPHQVEELRCAYRAVSTSAVSILRLAAVSKHHCLSTITDNESIHHQNVNAVLAKIKNAKPSAHIALAGPTLLGEGPIFSIVEPREFDTTTAR